VNGSRRPAGTKQAQRNLSTGELTSKIWVLRRDPSSSRHVQAEDTCARTTCGTHAPDETIYMLGTDSLTKSSRDRAFQAATVPQPSASTKAGCREFKAVANKPTYTLHAQKTQKSTSAENNSIDTVLSLAQIHRLYARVARPPCRSCTLPRTT